jgi:menaquinone-dependent protoporphyrinogen oxidase
MKVLIVWGSKMGGTEEIAAILGEELQLAGFEVTLAAAGLAPPPRDFEAVVIGGALYANRWHPEARRFVSRYRRELRQRPTWMFSSGPLDDSAHHREIPPPSQVAALMDRIGAIGHITFGGRLSPEHAKGGMAAAMARNHAGDWRDPAHIRAWAAELARLLPTARPRPAIDPPARRLSRLGVHAALAWFAYALTAAALPLGSSLTLLAAPLLFAATAYLYFRPGRTRDPGPTALGFVAIGAVLALGAATATALLHIGGRPPFAKFAEVTTFWGPLLLAFVATWGVGALMLSIPSSPPSSPPASSPDRSRPAPT